MDDPRTINAKNKLIYHRIFFLFILMLYVPVSSYGRVRTVSSPYHTFSWAVNQCLMHILSPVTDNNPSWRRGMTVAIISWSLSTEVWSRPGLQSDSLQTALCILVKEENDSGNYFMINLHESVVRPGDRKCETCAILHWCYILHFAKISITCI